MLTSRFDPELPQQERLGNLTIHRIGKGRRGFFFHSFRKGAKLLLQNPQIEVIHASTYTSAIPASILWTLFKKKKILTVHEIFWRLWKQFKPRYSRWVYQLFERLIFKFPHNEYHCVSLYTLNSVRLYYGLPDKKLHLIYNGVDADFWNAGQVSEETKKKRRKKFWWENKFLMLYYGHSGVSKGIDYLIEAMPEILMQNADGVLIFNLIPAKRDREIRGRINPSVTSWHLPWQGDKNEVIVFSGFPQEELRELIACADVVIAPSLAEGFGSVHSEACAMGKPLITTQVAAIPEVVSGKVVFVQAASSEAIIQGIQQAREGKYVSIAEKRFDWDESVEKLEKLY